MSGRPERDVDPNGGPVQRLAHELRELRKEAGLTYREMAQASGRGASTLSRAAAGEQLPAWPVVRAYVEACRGDVGVWEERWRAALEEDAAAAVADQDGEGEGAPPYRGLRRFEGVCQFNG